MANRAFAYYPGCSLHHGVAKEYDVSSRLTCRALGVELREIEGWTCCGATSVHLSSRLLAAALPARNLALVGKMGLPMALACAMCFSRHRYALHEMEDASMREKVAGALGDGVPADVEVRHLLQILDGVDIKASRSLDGLKVACYYGCLLVRPLEVTGFDDEENPQAMDRLLASVGAQPLDWGLKTACCGAGMGLPRQDMVLRLTGRILRQAVAEGADCLAVACPMCHYNLDSYQKAIGGGLNLPVLYFTQLLGLALGFSPHELRLDKHLVDTGPLLRSRGLV
ncbi:MAG: CoB--CoM heterodisulfide reductase iron-sulfur subunit B family protein [Chloroflexi bacterium]|nr:CoB--CoM heterodisulfide reductase iron-sulfur subunit B family protein [Chloroflexota bacterium]